MLATPLTLALHSVEWHQHRFLLMNSDVSRFAAHRFSVITSGRNVPIAPVAPIEPVEVARGDWRVTFRGR